MNVEYTLSSLVEKYPSALGHIEPNSIYCQYTARKSAKVPFAIVGINDKTFRGLLDEYLVDVRYVLKINSTAFDSYSSTQLVWMLIEALLAVSVADPDGKVYQADFVTFSPIVEVISNLQLGADWLDNPALPDPLFETVDSLTR